MDQMQIDMSKVVAAVRRYASGTPKAKERSTEKKTPVDAARRKPLTGRGDYCRGFYCKHFLHQ